MKTLFVPKLYLWPRFHLAVKSSLDKINVRLLNYIIKLYSMFNLKGTTEYLSYVCRYVVFG